MMKYEVFEKGSWIFQRKMINISTDIIMSMKKIFKALETNNFLRKLISAHPNKIKIWEFLCFHFVFVKFRDLHSFENKNDLLQNSLYGPSRTAQRSLFIQSEAFLFYFLVIFSRNFHSILETGDFQRKALLPPDPLLNWPNKRVFKYWWNLFKYLHMGFLKIRPTKMTVNILGKFPVRELDPRIYRFSLNFQSFKLKKNIFFDFLWISSWWIFMVFGSTQWSSSQKSSPCSENLIGALYRGTRGCARASRHNM